MQEKLVEVKTISKQFPGVLALNDISFDIYRGTVHCIVGENGAGKSTFIKILTGAIPRTKGTILFHGQEYSPRSTRDAMDSGISVLFQELNVVEQLTVEQNLTLGKEETHCGVIRKKGVAQKVLDILKSLDATISPNQRVSELSVAQKQVIEITKAIAADADVIIMDEPTAAISDEEVKRLFAIIANLKQQNVTVIYISHRLSEIFQIGDYVTVLRDGKLIGTKSLKELSANVSETQAYTELIRMMLGKVVVEHYLPSPIDYDTKILELKNVRTPKLKNVSFKLHKGEILGFYGLVGSGKTEIARVIYGMDPLLEGSLEIYGAAVTAQHPGAVIRKGVTLVPEERRTQGLFTRLAICDNIPIMNMKKISWYGILNKFKEKALAREYIQKVRIAARNENQKVALLSGGNQQKVVFSKCLNADSTILMLDEPTRGIDVGAKEEIHKIIRDLAQEGVSSIVFSSELPEIINLCDTIILLYEGEIKAVLQNSVQSEAIDSEKIMHIVTGGKVQ